MARNIASLRGAVARVAALSAMLGAVALNHDQEHDEALRIAAAFLRAREGYRSHPYRDVAHNQTIGYGHKIRPGESFKKPLNADDAMQLLMLDLGAHRRAVDSLQNVDQMTVSQRAALYSFAYNCGPGAIRASGIGAAVESGDLARVPKIMARYVMATDRVTHKKNVVAGLVARRAAEIELWNYGVKK